MICSFLVAMLMLLVCLSTIPFASSVYTQGINLGTCANFAVQAGTSANFNGVVTQVTVGNVGVSPGTSITGNYVLGSGSTENNSPLAISCAADEMTAYLEAQAAVCTAANNLADPDLGGKTLVAGVYCASFMQITATTLTLDGQGNSSAVWVFQTATTVTTATSTSFILANGAQAKNVYWQVGTALTVGSSASFVGTVLAGTDVNIGSGATLTGRALAQAAVNCESGNTITAPASTTSAPSAQPSTSPSNQPSTTSPSSNPSSLPTASPSSSTSSNPPTSNPSAIPTSSPSNVSTTTSPSSNPSSLPTASPTSTIAASSSSSDNGLSNGSIAGIVIGSVVGALLLIGAAIYCCCKKQFVYESAEPDAQQSQV